MLCCQGFDLSKNPESIVPRVPESSKTTAIFVKQLTIFDRNLLTVYIKIIL